MALGPIKCASCLREFTPTQESCRNCDACCYSGKDLHTCGVCSGEFFTSDEACFTCPNCACEALCERAAEAKKTAKRDVCELRLDLIPSEVLMELSKVFARGAKRYGEENWKKSRLFQDADPVNHALKHLLMYKDDIPDDEDPEGIDINIHLRHALCNIVFELYYQLNPDKYPSRQQLKQEIADGENRKTD